MKQLYYTFRTLIRGKGSNIIKVISLTLGLFVGILLFARVAFDMNYNTGYEEPEKLCVIMARYTVSGLANDPMSVVMGPVPSTVAEAFPGQVVSAAVTRNGGENSYFFADKQTDAVTIFADSLFFRTLGIAVVRGQVSDLTNPGMAFVSEEFARETFGSEDPVGKVIMRNKNQEITVKGVYREVGENNSVRPRVVLSFIKEQMGNYGWGGGDSFQGYVRLKSASDVDMLNDRMDGVIEQHMPFDPEKNGWGVKYSLQPIRDVYKASPAVKRMVTIYSVLGVSILLIAALNYVLISISSLSRRARPVGIHKCNGATDGNIFSMFIYETLIIVAASLSLVALLIYNFREMIEDLIQASLPVLFAWQTLWVPALVVLFVILLAGVIPGRMFSNIPVTQVFSRFTDRKKNWKRMLLFVQFGGVAFVFGLLCVVLLQYRLVINGDVGYKPDGVAYGYYRLKIGDARKSAIRNLPMVEGLSLSISPMATGLSGDHIRDEAGRTLFSTRFNWIDPEYVPLYGLQIIEGRNVLSEGETLVNEEFVRMRHWTDSPIGKKSGSGTEDVIVGVVKDYVNNSFYSAKDPVILQFAYPEWMGIINVRLKEPFRENLMALNREMEELFPTNVVVFSSLREQIDGRYSDVRRFRDSVMVAFISIILITLMGLIGYVSDEMQRRSKEIAIRKVNGATAGSILSLMSREIVWIALPAILLGCFVSYRIGSEWITQFSSLQIGLGLPLYIIIGTGILFIILSCVVAKSWSIANENPVKSIKTE